MPASHAALPVVDVMQSPYLLIPQRGNRWGFGDAVQACTPATHVAIGILPITDDNDATIELADLIVGVAGELPSFGQLHGFSVDGVSLTTAALPDGW
jgi:hypothetical protein